eukprot:TRINITY_DN58913_c0_g1_i1.p1 TRINITY_DN58913_c0_g1~~TRINITY_DN58913_c0_g1_i1.p1  ORF type:complete len:610 (+),score=79.99 TRINITY_DN58913_c0_g1_i1:70-1830(+)
MMPTGTMAQEPLVMANGSPGEIWSPTFEARAGSARPALRRTADAVLGELGRYFEAHSEKVAKPDARTVLGGRLARFARDLLGAREESLVESVEWWCEFLLAIEDSRPFTRSNWARASAFEDTLSCCRLLLLNLSRSMRETSQTPALHRLRETLCEAHNVARHAADYILELLYIALKPHPASTRCCFHDLQRMAEKGASCSGSADRVCFHILDEERRQAADTIAMAFFDRARASRVYRSDDSTDVIRKAPHEDELAVMIPEMLRTRLDLGVAADTAFVELHGLYCLFVALLQRLELCRQAVSEFGRFACFLKLHQAAMLDLQQHLPHLQRRIFAAITTLASAYEDAPRASAPAGRANILEKCRCLKRQLELSKASSEIALLALKDCSPVTTLQDFEGWRQGDNRWSQVARLRLTSEVLLPAQEMYALDVDVAALAASLEAGPEIQPPFEHDGNVATRIPSTGESERRRSLLSLEYVVDKDTRLHQAASGLANLSEEVWHGALQPACGWTAGVVGEQLSKAGKVATEQIASLTITSIHKLQRAKVTYPADVEWTLLNEDGDEVGRAEFTEDHIQSSHVGIGETAASGK